MWTLHPSGMSLTMYSGTTAHSMFFSFTLMFDVNSSRSVPICRLSCFGKENTVSSPPASNYIVYLISISASWWCPCAQSFVQLFEACVGGNQLWASQKSTSQSPASFLTLSTNFPMTSDSALLPAFAFQAPMLFSVSCFSVWSVFSWMLV